MRKSLRSLHLTKLIFREQRHLHPQQNLRLPLVGSRFLPAPAEEQIHSLADIRLVRQLVVEMVAAGAVVGGCQHHDDAAVLNGRFRSGHALNSLVHILVQGVAAVGGDDDVRRHLRALAQTL